MTENTTADPAVTSGAAPVDPVDPAAAGGATELTQDQEDVLEALRDVVDPELGINVVDLGLIYGVGVDADRIATIDMTLTSAACPLTDVIEDQAREALEAWSPTSGSTGCGCLRGARRALPTTGASSCALSALTSRSGPSFQA
jgi:metal-sulfur cluster biosynthetic enzyme